MLIASPVRPRWFNLPPPEPSAPLHITVMAESTPTPADESLTQNVLPRDLAPGDVVSPAWSQGRLSAFDTALVARVTDKVITLFRPYATSPSYVYGREPSVIPLIGGERYQIRRSSTVHVFRRWHTTVV
jgi:hypothetical protein